MSIGENDFRWPLKRVWKKVASQGKVSEKSGNLDMDIEWQPVFVDTGYPHNSRADKDSYPHDGRADEDSYPHDRHNQYIMLSL